MLIYDLSTLEMVGKEYNHEKKWQKAKGRIVPLEEIGKTLKKQRGKKWENIGDNGQSIWKTH